MVQQGQQQRLEQFASIAKQTVLSSQSHLHPKDRAHSDMLPWCHQQRNIVVLENGDILCSEPTSRVVQNCKIIMLEKGLTVGDVKPATDSLISLLLDNAEAWNGLLSSSSNDSAAITVSTQQRRLRQLIRDAMAMGVSDIHIEVRAQRTMIRFRRDGELFLHAEWQSKVAREVVSVAFNKETDHACTHFNPLLPQNAAMPLTLDDKSVRLRLTSLPAHQGFDVALRILARSDDTLMSLGQLGYSTDQVALLHRAIRMPYGAVIIAGPTGSGKTTTLASCMDLVSQQRKIYTIEDPVEKLIPSATQVPVNTEHYDRSFASMARTVLRMDPDVIVFGEMRDEDSAQVMVRAAITGHLAFSTLHAKTAMDIVTRLVDLGVSRSLLASPDLLVCLICQRLVPLLCDACKAPLKTLPNVSIYQERWKTLWPDLIAYMDAPINIVQSARG